MGSLERLREARERSALTQEQVALALAVPREAVSFWETGERTPSPARLKELARLYRVNTGFLLGNEALNERRGREILYRGLPEGDAKAERGVEGWLDFLDAWADFLEDSRASDRLTGARKPPRSLNEGYVDDLRRASKLAANVREHFDLGLEPLPNLGAFLDKIGVLVYRAPLGNLGQPTLNGGGAGVSGAFFNHPRLGWSILVNTSVTIGRQTFTLAHEFAHALYHYESGGAISRADEAKTDPKERFANVFAAHFLVPSKSLREIINHHGGPGVLDPLLVLQFAHYFGVSYSTLLFRLKAEHLITEAQRDAFANRSVQRMAHQLRIPIDSFTTPDASKDTGLERLPFSVLDMVKREIEHGNLSASRAAGILNVDEQALRDTVLSDEGELTDDDRTERAEHAFL